MRQLAHLISESDLAELEVEKGDLRIRLVRYSPAPASHQHAVSAPVATTTTFPVAAALSPAAVVPALSPSDADHPGAVKSPMVGTAYRRASPDSKAFVEIGSVVKAGEKLLLVEAMKTFNEIVAPRAGTVTAIFIDDGQPVEYGEPLLVIE
ncbi:acetyl-CoA carboxylase biotin carboxyl carrier protein [Lichenihabitans sp. PAMC28606]|uniref:acetyl-CoA carboxylase biotin carboxyl carrier protein n=1 Tax=Lichenihabitans sp. PAMC28606 TaxID=2880932 RepID=UPI001D0B6E15|nr:acetyl-CoA carboxylase biotin carboxyl carrier protein [Lichenihabitans sp. PAMC28606]UDL96559.1 acetyl-CoA carboxylase biotin carboxyl carrier protein [Lichenihabitans sp. PAMC28606]